MRRGVNIITFKLLRVYTWTALPILTHMSVTWYRKMRLQLETFCRDSEICEANTVDLSTLKRFDNI